MADALAEEIIQQWERGEADRDVFRMSWQDQADYIEPDRNDYIVDRVPGQKRMRKVYDGLPIWANQQFTAGIHSMVTSPTLQWFSLMADDDRINAIYRVKQWLQASSRSMYRYFNSARFNFASMSSEVYNDVGCIGQGCMFALEGRRGPLFTTRSMKEIIYELNDEERVDTVIRNWQWTRKQALAAWGDRVGDRVKGGKDQDKFRFIHAVRPRRKRDAQRSDQRNMAWESVYVDVDDKIVIGESGFQEFPCMAPGFSRLTGETYMRGPGWYALPDVKMLNEVAKTVLKAAQKIIDPPLMVPDQGFLSAIKTVPGSFNYYRAGSRDKIEPIRTEGNVQLGMEVLNAVREQVKRYWFVDLLRLPVDPNDPASAGKGSTATYWNLYQSKEFMAFSPVLSRLYATWTGPLIDRVFAMLWRKSLMMRFQNGAPFPPPPPELNGAKLEVEYLSPLQVAQKTSELDSAQKLFSQQVEILKVNPKAVPVIDDEQFMRGMADDLNAPTWALKSPERYAKDQQTAQQAEQQLNQSNALEKYAGAAKDGTAAIANLNQSPQQEAA